MLTQIKILAGLELCNICGLNVFRFSKDRKAKRKTIGMMALWAVLIAILFFYVGGLSYGLLLLEMEAVIPAYLIGIASLVIFFFGIFKTGNVIFRKSGMDMLASLPVSQTAIVVSRFLRMYAENLALTLLILLPGLAVYAWFVRPGASFYLAGLLSAFLVPLVPIAGAALIGALVTAISSRMKHKSLMEAVLSVGVVLVVLLGSSQLTRMEDGITPEKLKDLSATILELLGRLYPPAVWLGSMIRNGELPGLFLWGAVFLTVLGVVVGLIAANFYAISRRLYSTFAKHNYQMEKLRRNAVLISLCKREFKRYFSSGTYVSNTIMGPIMGTVFAGALLWVDLDAVMTVFPISIDIYGLIPFALAGIFCMMTTTAVSVSMEGKNWWIVKSLPLTSKSILDAKILMNLILMLPFYLVSEVLLMLALRPGMWEGLWLLLIPAVIILFSCVYGITINLHFPVMNWENEVTVVKQSAASLIGGLGGFLLAILGAVTVMAVPPAYSDLVKGLLCLLILGITAILYRKNHHINI